MTKPKGTAKLKAELTQEAIKKVPPGKASASTLASILKRAKDDDDSSDSG